LKAFVIALAFLSFGNLASGDWNSHSDRKQKEIAHKAFNQIEQDLQTLEEFAQYSNNTIDAIIQKSVRALKLKGSWKLALELEEGWSQFDGELVRITKNPKNHSSIRAIGDFAPLNQWLSDAYEQIEADLGHAYCFSQRISDLKTINHGLVVVFEPCTYGYDEFFKHFASDDPKYRSVLPVVSYWATVIGCYAGSYGTGVFMFCGAAGTLVESMVDEQFGPMIAPKIYEGACTP